MANVYTADQIFGWVTAKVSETVWENVSATPGQTSASISSATGLSTDQVYWALDNPPLDGNNLPQQFHFVPSSDSEFFIVHGQKNAARGHL